MVILFLVLFFGGFSLFAQPYRVIYDTKTLKATVLVDNTVKTNFIYPFSGECITFRGTLQVGENVITVSSITTPIIFVSTVIATDVYAGSLILGSKIDAPPSKVFNVFNTTTVIIGDGILTGNLPRYHGTIAIGRNAYNNYDGVAIGWEAHTNFEGIGIGKGAYRNFFAGVGIMGYENYSGGIGIRGYNNHHSGVGLTSYNNHSYGIGILGNNNFCGGIGIGKEASFNQMYGLGIGVYSQYNRPYSTSIGGYTLSFSSSVALGWFARSLAVDSISLGAGSLTTAERSVAIGAYTVNHETETIRLGYPTRIVGGIFLPIMTTTAAITLDRSHSTVLCDAGTAPFTVTLPCAGTVTGIIYTIKKIDATTNAITISPATGQNIDGATSYSLTAQWDFVEIQSDGSHWYVIGK